MQPLAGRQRGKIRTLRRLEHRAVRPLEPGIDDILFLAKMRTHIIERDSQRNRYLMKAHCFPRRLFAQFNRGIDNLVSCWHLYDIAPFTKKKGRFSLQQIKK